MVELSKQRGTKTKELGATAVINLATENAAEHIKALFGGGVEVAF